jgi:hypothetical protein
MAVGIFLMSGFLWRVATSDQYQLELAAAATQRPYPETAIMTLAVTGFLLYLAYLLVRAGSRLWWKG